MIDEQRALDTACERLPIFPLPRTVLLPGAVLPLHVFEPRYRALVAHALDRTEGVFGIATLKPGYQADYEGRPPVWPELGIGRIVAHQPLPDGRSNLILKAIGRGRIIREFSADHSFREVQVQLLALQPPPSSRVYDRVRALVAQIGHYSAEARTEAERLLELEGTELLDGLARKLLEDVDSMRFYLAEGRVEARAAQVESALAEVLALAVSEVGEA